MDRLYPPKPEEPLATDCCGTGCTPCVLDIYNKELEIWKRECYEIETFGSICNGTIESNGEQDDVISKDTYREYPILSIQDESPDTYKFRFGLKPGQKLPLNLGQHLVMRWKCTEDASITRQYTPVSRCNTDIGYFDVVIKIYPKGRMSKYVKEWRVGNLVEWRGPFGHLDYKPSQFSNIVLLTAGTGIAPMTQIIHSILDNEDDETVIYLLYSLKSYTDILCKDWLDKWKDYWNFKVCFFLTQDENTTIAKFGEKVINSRINKTHIESILNNNIQKSFYFICGTKSFDKDMINLLNGINVPSSKYFKF